nr:MAG: capsid protein [Cressdnaviricota sp.]
MEPATRLRIGGNILGSGSLKRAWMAGGRLVRGRVPLRAGRRVNRRLFTAAGAPRPGTRVARYGARTRVRAGYTRTGGSFARLNRRSRGGLLKQLKNYDNLSQAISSGGGNISSPNTQNSGQILVGMPQGTDVGQRIGRKIYAKSIYIKGTIQFVPGTGTVGTDFARLWLVWDKQANGTSPSSTDVWSNNVIGKEMVNLDNNERFRILKCETVEFQAAAGVSGAYDSQVKTIDWYMKLAMEVPMNSTAGAIGEFKSNNLVLFFGSLNNLCTFTGASRLRYYDQ